jgi:hypothetical protein
MAKKKKPITKRYTEAKEAKVGAFINCPSCNTLFEKKHYQQAFCQTKGKTVCKDKYWNTVTPEKRCNTTRISPASAKFMATRYDHLKPNIVGGVEKFQGYTSEGYRIWDGVAYNEWDEPVYHVDPYNDTHPFDLD